MKGSGSCNQRGNLSVDSATKKNKKKLETVHLKRENQFAESIDGRIHYAKKNSSFLLKEYGVSKTWIYFIPLESDQKALNKIFKDAKSDLSPYYTNRKSLYKDICKLFAKAGLTPPEEKVKAKVKYSVKEFKHIQIGYEANNKEMPWNLFVFKPKSSEKDAKNIYDALNGWSFATLEEAKQAIIATLNKADDYQNSLKNF